MFSERDLERLMAAHLVPEAGRNAVRQAFRNGPARKLERRTDGVRTRYLSKKMGAALTVESRTVELPALITYESSPKVLAMFAQPMVIPVVIQGKDGPRETQHTPDFLVIEDSGIYLDEWRTDERLERLAASRPRDFAKDERGLWHYYPAEVAAKTLGLRHRLRSDAELPKKFLTNTALLADLMREESPPLPAAELDRLKACFGERACIPYLQLVYEHGLSAQAVLQAIAHNHVFVDLFETRLDKTDTLLVYRDDVAYSVSKLLESGPVKQRAESVLELAEGTTLRYDGKRYIVQAVGQANVTLASEEGELTQLPKEHIHRLFQQDHLHAEAAPRQQRQLFDLGRFKDARGLATAMSRLSVVEGQVLPTVSERTVRRYRQKVRGVLGRQEQVAALMPKRPGRTERTDPEVFAVALMVMGEFHNRAAAPTRQATYLEVVKRCEEKTLVPMSRASFYRWVRKHESTRKRFGAKVAYQQAPSALQYEDDLPVHGTHRHSVVYIDHTQLNIFVAGQKVENLGKPWLTLAVDGRSEPMAMYMDFEGPRSASILMLMRDYVRRHNRLPDTVVMDNGAEMQSTEVLMFCSLFGIHIRWRRRSKPRDSHLVERLFGTTETEILANLDGNTRQLKDPRSVARTHQPELHIRWTLPALYEAFDQFLFDVYIHRVHPAHGISLAELTERERKEFGDRSHVFVRYDSLFRLLTSVHPTTKPTRRLDPRLGVYVDGMHYWHDKLALGKRGEEVEVRLEMWNARLVYVQFKDEWLVAEARDMGLMNGRFLAEYQAAVRQEQKRKRTAAQNSAKSGKQAAAKSRLWVPEFHDERLREQQTEMHHVYVRRGMAAAREEAENPHAKTLELTQADIASEKLSSALADVAAETGTAMAEAPKPEASATEQAVFNEDDYF